MHQSECVTVKFGNMCAILAKELLDIDRRMHCGLRSCSFPDISICILPYFAGTGSVGFLGPSYCRIQLPLKKNFPSHWEEIKMFPVFIVTIFN